MKKILITTGGTGGHVIPAEIIGEHLKEIYEIKYSTDLRGLKYLSSNKDKIIIIDTPKLNLNLYLPFNLIKLFYLLLLFLFSNQLEHKNLYLTERILKDGLFMVQNYGM